MTTIETSKIKTEKIELLLSNQIDSYANFLLYHHFLFSVTDQFNQNT